MSEEILIVDDDKIFVQVLADSFVKRGLKVVIAYNAKEALAIMQEFLPDKAVVDLKMPGFSGLSLISQFKQLNNNIKIVILTGYASINTAVEAIKLGAYHYLVKPANSDEILASFNSQIEVDNNYQITDKHVSIHNFELEQINATMRDTNFNISETARRLGIHRRTLQRKLQKYNFN